MLAPIVALFAQIPTPTGPTCSVGSAHSKFGQTFENFTDGVHQRCISVIGDTSKGPLPLLFFFHGSGGNAKNCGEQPDVDTGTPFADVAINNGFALVCGEANQYPRPSGLEDAELDHSKWGSGLGESGFVGGQWLLPESVNTSTGNRCVYDDHTPELRYLKAALDVLGAMPQKYDTSRVFFSGCSMGSMMSLYSATCMHKLLPDPSYISAFGTHSSGYKIKGDGIALPPDNYDGRYTWGECPTCKWFPVYVEPQAIKPSLKACIYDNEEDPAPPDTSFYQTSVQLEKYWKAAGNPTESHYWHGHHCTIHNWLNIATCLDDKTGRLIGNKTTGVSVEVA